MLKSARIGNSASRWKVAKLVSCTVDCLACPCPGINIPDTLFVGINANFKLERFEVSSEEKDPGLRSRLGYFIDTKSFKEHLQMFDKQIVQARSTCNDHKAAKPDKKT
ncbi:hypothetical protein EDD18DRAFT_1077948 [Armillaria luteobubalina]|uniref:Uncharacterized protein n=1 Tax=Armillaria luteobubalina TaxID=153913 RepID=A0AA39UR69_9AGAR|nr:hypothetical protein EDD18DRAFT_1077948 [Armillaria luteobubalina]